MENLKCLLFVSILISASYSLNAKTIRYVKADGVGDGSSWTDAANNIQTMIDKAVSGDEVWVAKGTYLTGSSMSSSFVLKDGVNIYGGFTGDETAISDRSLSDSNGNGKIEPWEFTNSTVLNGDIDGVADVWSKVFSGNTWYWSVTGNSGNSFCIVKSINNFLNMTYLDGFSISGGNNPNAQGGGVSTKGNTIIQNCAISNCSAAYGGGICTNGTVKNCFIQNCTAISTVNDYPNRTAQGGGIYSTGPVTNCTINNCSAYYGLASSYGGGIYSNNTVANCNVINCTVKSEYYTTSGGGIYSLADVNNCFVSNCSAESSTSYGYAYSYGGGVYSNSILNCTVVNCSAFSLSFSSSGSPLIAINGGGVYVTNSAINSNIVNCTTYSYPHRVSAGGIYSLGNVQNCATSNNLDNGSSSNISATSQTNNIIPTLSSSYINASDFAGIATNDTQRNKLLSVDWCLKSGSVCINAGTTTGLSTDFLSGDDIAGNQRIQDGHIDIGAFEYNSPSVATELLFNQINKFTYSVINGTLNLSNLGNDVFVKLFDVNGKLITTKNTDSQLFQFILPTHGVYIVKVTSNSGIENKKVVW